MGEQKGKALKQIAIRRSARLDAYWSEHAEERAMLESKKAAAETIVSSLKTELESIPELIPATELRRKIEALSLQKKGLGLFKGSEKKAIQAQIDSFKMECDALEKILYEKQNSIQAKLDAQKTIIDEVDEELTKDR